MIDKNPTRTLQAELVAAGFDPGDIDGIAGPRTRAAVRALQTMHGLAADGIVGPRTRALLAPVPPWMRLAGQLVGTREAAGAADNPVILGWARALGLAYAGDNVP